jgi:predicted Zn-dependent protease with MMP-like domain
LRVHTGGYAAEKDEEAFLRQMEQMNVLDDMPLVEKVAVTTFHGVQLSERSLQRAKGMAKRFTGRDIEFVNF